MKTMRGTATAAVLLVGGLLGGCVTVETTPIAPTQAVAIEEVIGQVQQALADVQTTLAARNFPALKDVRLTLQTVALRKEGGALKLWVVSLGGTEEKSQTQQVVITLVPPAAGRPKLVAGESLTADLEAAILSAADGVQMAREGRVPLVTSAVDVEIGFTVKRTGTGGAGVVLSPVAASLASDATASTMQTIKVSFAGR